MLVEGGGAGADAFATVGECGGPTPLMGSYEEGPADPHSNRRKARTGSWCQGQPAAQLAWFSLWAFHFRPTGSHLLLGINGLTLRRRSDASFWLIAPSTISAKVGSAGGAGAVSRSGSYTSDSVFTVEVPEALALFLFTLAAAVPAPTSISVAVST